MTTTNTNSMIHEIIGDGYGSMVIERLDQGWTAYIITFMFHSLRGSRASVHRQMEREAERIYATVLTRIVRDPKNPKVKDELPVWILCPDYPVPKHTKKSLRDVTVNEGLHLQGIALIPPASRMKEGLDEHFARHQERYVRPGDPLERVHAKLLTRDPVYVAKYTFKSVLRRRHDFDHVFILPRTRSEMVPSPLRTATMEAHR